MSDSSVSFEEAIKMCDEISTKILSGNLDLNECVSAYSDGIRYLELAEKLLNNAKAEFEKITPVKEVLNELQ